LVQPAVTNISVYYNIIFSEKMFSFRFCIVYRCLQILGLREICRVSLTLLWFCICDSCLTVALIVKHNDYETESDFLLFFCENGKWHP